MPLTGLNCELSLTAGLTALVLDQPHHPARRDRSTDEQREAEGAEPDHHPWLRPLGYSEDYRSKQGKQQNRSKMRDHHERFLPVASECASTAEITFNKPATTMNLVP
jgi:hypothetical protein